jgi:hypothetical protein
MRYNKASPCRAQLWKAVLASGTFFPTLFRDAPVCLQKQTPPNPGPLGAHHLYGRSDPIISLMSWERFFMKVGLFVTNQQQLATDMVAALDDQIAMVALARDRGWNSLFTGQHYLNEGDNKQLTTVKSYTTI